MNTQNGSENEPTPWVWQTTVVIIVLPVGGLFIFPYVLLYFAAVYLLIVAFLVVMAVGALIMGAGDAGLRRIVPWLNKRYGDKGSS